MNSNSGGGRAIKRSEDGNKMMSATSSRSRPAAAAAAVGSGNGARATGEPQQDKHSTISDASAISSSSSGSPKLVFGLNPRAHRPKRPEAPAAQQTTSAETTSPRRSAGNENKPSGSPQQANGSATATRGHIRASKYGNFYKPQATDEDLTASAPKSCAQSSSGKAAARQQAQEQQRATSGSGSGAGGGGGGRTRASMTKQKASATSGGESSERKAAAATSATGTLGSVRARSRSPDRRPQMARRKSFDEDMSTMKLETPKQQQQQQQQTATQAPAPILKARTQFNILPPPQMSIATTGKGSVVDYAKSRIYDKPSRPILANPPPPPSTVLDDQPGQVPAAISSGFKPPKQVMVAKAREKWEGGEPFAKCKSRKRLAAQANKKLFPGTWSMTSVVATQQLHLQQALAQFNSSSTGNSPFNRSSGALPAGAGDPSVKVLSRGSVLERIQQYERAPGSAAAGLSSSSSLDSFFDEEDDRQISLALSRSSSASSALSLGSDGAGGDAQQREQSTSDDAAAAAAVTSHSKQAQYKTRVSSLQQQQQPTAQSDTAPHVAADQQIIQKQQQQQQQQRRASLRRRSSIGLLGRSQSLSSQSLIPKFYHPNGKPNTYEIELQKRNIVACFEKLPERRAQLTSAPTGAGGLLARRQFHQIALACGYSEYFKVPLLLYVKHKLETSPQLAALGQPNPRQRKSSTVALNTNGVSSSPLILRPLVKSASIDSSSPTAAKQAEELSDQVAGSADKRQQSGTPLSSVTCDQFLACWRELISRAFDNAAQFVHLLTLGQRNFLQPEDFVPLVQSIIDDHPGLKFLRAAPDFHMRYIQTVIARIYYNVNRSWTGKLTLQELRKSNLLAVLQVLSQEEDINQITDYFSYEHFYVIYCKFWSLDQDHDLFISKEDLARHNDAAISSRIIERLFAGIVSKQIQKTGKMSYSDFVWFLIAEEDKKHPRSIEYWFRLMDLDGDGYISMYEMEYFYYEQMKRLELMNIEALPFLDSACQILDLVNPREKNKISLADLKRTRMATIFFDTFINLEKYLEHESREFVSTRDVVQNGVVVSDWDRYASEEYEGLVTEETTV